MVIQSSILTSIFHVNKAHIEGFNLISKNEEHYEEPVVLQEIEVLMRPYRSMQCRCPVCMQKCPVYDHKAQGPSRIRHLDAGNIPVYLCYQACRVKCKEHGVKTEYVPWRDGNSFFTKDFNNQVAWLATQCSKSCIAQLMDIDWHTVGHCIGMAKDRLLPDPRVRYKGVRRICVDETSYHKGHTYITVVFDMDKNQVIWVHDGFGKEIFELFCQDFVEYEGHTIDMIAGDGAAWIDSCKDEYFPKAIRCIDPFHVTMWVTDAMDAVRKHLVNQAKREYDKLYKQCETDIRQAANAIKEARARKSEAEAELLTMPRRGRPSKRKIELKTLIESIEIEIKNIMDTLSGAEFDATGKKKTIKLRPEDETILEELKEKRKALKNSKHALGHAPEKCTKSQSDKIKMIENSYPELYLAYQEKEALRIILHMRDPELAINELAKWIEETKKSSLKQMRDIAKKIDSWRTEIINSITYRGNSAKSEATNTTIKCLIATGRGFRNIDNLISLILLKCSDLRIPLRNRAQMSEEYARAKRAQEAERRREKQEQKRSQYAM